MTSTAVGALALVAVSAHAELRDRPLEAVADLEAALKRDPLNVFILIHLGLCLQAAEQYEAAAFRFRRALEIEEHLPAIMQLALNHALRGMLTEALACAERAYALAPETGEARGTLAGLLARSGETGRVKALLETLKSCRIYGTPIGFVLFHLLGGEVEAAMDWAEKAIEQRHLLILFHLRDPLARPLRSSPRWPALARMANLPETAS